MALPALLKLVFRFVPSVVTAVMMTTAIRATVKPYSMAVAPELVSEQLGDQSAHAGYSWVLFRGAHSSRRCPKQWRTAVCSLMSDVFISYARSTARQADEVAAALAALGYQVWKDSDIPAHRSFTDEIEERIAAAKAVVVVWSAEAVKSQWVRSEADRARQDAKIVQLCIDRMRLPMPFDQIECADLDAWTGDLADPGVAQSQASVAHLVGLACEPGRRPAIATPDRPSIAVMPFKNITPGKNAEYLADGVSEDIITALSRQHLFFVIASRHRVLLQGPRR